MKISDKPTNNILVKACTDSEWDSCDFAIFSCDEEWVKMMKKRLEIIKLVKHDKDISSLRFHDCDAHYYAATTADGEDDEEIYALLKELKDGGRWWTFVELEENEEKNYTPPGNDLDCEIMALYKNASGKYISYGKHSDEKFWTETLPFNEIMETLTNYRH